MISITKTATYPAPIESVFDAVTAEDVLPKVLLRHGPVPAVVGTVVLDGPEWNRPACLREVHLDDGSMLLERIDTFERPAAFAYDVEPERGLLRHVIRAARGEWRFVDDSGRTRVEWTYRFTPRRGPLAPVVWVFSRIFGGYMQAAHERLAQRSLVVS